jgi:hypothetical protein
MDVNLPKKDEAECSSHGQHRVHLSCLCTVVLLERIRTVALLERIGILKSCENRMCRLPGMNACDSSPGLLAHAKTAVVSAALAVGNNLLSEAQLIVPT